MCINTQFIHSWQGVNFLMFKQTFLYFSLCLLPPALSLTLFSLRMIKH